MLLPSEDYSKHLFTHCMLHFIQCGVNKVVQWRALRTELLRPYMQYVQHLSLVHKRCLNWVHVRRSKMKYSECLDRLFNHLYVPVTNWIVTWYCLEKLWTAYCQAGIRWQHGQMDRRESVKERRQNNLLPNRMKERNHQLETSDRAFTWSCDQDQAVRGFMKAPVKQQLLTILLHLIVHFVSNSYLTVFQCQISKSFSFLCQTFSLLLAANFSPTPTCEW